MAVRMAIAAGRFYSSDQQECLSDLKKIISSRHTDNLELPSEIKAGIVPHAGWVFSGDLCGMVLNAIKQRQEVDTFILFGANHSVNSHSHMIYDVGQWASPLGTINIDEDFSAGLMDHCDGLLHANCQAHSQEHSLEVIVPFIQYLFPEASIVPIMVQPIESADTIGKLTAELTEKYSGKKFVTIGSTDLTHYGPSYYNTSMGTGREAVLWAKNKNDRYMIDLICNMKFDQITDTAQTFHNACGAGAIAATIRYAADKGADKGVLLDQTCSYEIMEKKFGQSDMNSVGYAAIAF